MPGLTAGMVEPAPQELTISVTPPRAPKGPANVRSVRRDAMSWSQPQVRSFDAWQQEHMGPGASE